MDTIADLVATFALDPGGNGKCIRDLLRQDCSRFLEDAVPLLRRPSGSPGFDYLLALLCGNDLVLPLIADAALFTDEEAIDLARRLQRIDPSFDVRLMHLAVVANPDEENATVSLSTRRVLGVVAAVGDRRRTAPLLMMLLRHADSHVRSRAALLLGTATHNCAWASEQLRAGDTRVRANVIESLWGVKSDESKHVFRAAAMDPDNRVAGNALLGLYLSGAADSVRLIATMATCELPTFRSSAAWVMGKTEDPRFIACLNPMLTDTAPGVRRNVLRALAALRRLDNPREHLAVAVQPEGWEHARLVCRVRVSDGAARLVQNLPGTAFTCWSGDQLITDYDAEAISHSPGQYLLHARMKRNTELRIEACRSCNPRPDELPACHAEAHSRRPHHGAH